MKTLNTKSNVLMVKIMANKLINASVLPMKTPPSLPIKSIQMDLFSQFLTNDESEVSNTVDLWERIPKYFLSPQEQQRLRTTEGLAKPYTLKYVLRDHNGQVLPHKVVIQPALIEQPSGEYKAFFPTRSEEIIEEVLKKIFTEQKLGIHDPKNAESWVKFSYSMIRRELEHRSCGKTYTEIKHSLEVMSKCILTVYENKKEIYTGAILQDYCSVDRKQYLDDTKALHVARLSVFISHAVNTLKFRQYNYKRLMDCKEQLSRWLLRRLINRFTYASLTSSHNFMYSTIKAESGLLRTKREVDNRLKVIAALDELKEAGAIFNCIVEEKWEGRKIVDVKYTVTPTHKFSTEQKAANKREQITEEKASKNGLKFVDKSKSR